MKTDRELLELAAKAAGYPCYRTDERGWFQVKDHPLYSTWELWDPLADDGDALRLAVQLGLEIYHSINCSEWTVFVGYPSEQRIVYASEGYGSDQLAATRRAIVRAAAAIREQQ